MSLLERKDAEALITQSHQNESLTWTDKAIEKAWEWTQGHPYLTQLLCSVVWENFYDADSSHQGEVQAAEVDAAIDKTLQQGANAFHWIWDGLPPAERVVMAAMAEAPNAVITQDKLIEILNQSGVRLIVRELELAPETLTEWQLLRPSEGGYRFVVPLLRQWVLNHRPLKRVKEELDRLDPQAEGLFQTGQRFYAMSDLAEAERQLRLALRINPNHLKSRLLLGRVLLESDKASDSVAILEEAYRYDEIAARLDLIKALLALADGQSEADQINTYARVLAIDQAQPLALERRRMMWLKRGEAALQQDALDLALTAFKEAGETERFEHVLQLKRKRELVAQIESAKKYEQEAQWEAASAVYENLLKELPEEGEWKLQLQHVQNQAYLAQNYNDARIALENRKKEVAIEL